MDWIQNLWRRDIYSRMARLYRLGQPDTKRIARLRAFGMSQRQIANNLGLKPELVNKSIGRYYSSATCCHTRSQAKTLVMLIRPRPMQMGQWSGPTAPSSRHQPKIQLMAIELSWNGKGGDDVSTPPHRCSKDFFLK